MIRPRNPKTICKKQPFTKTVAMLLLVLILASCSGLEDQLPGTAIPAAPTLQIGTATAALTVENSEISAEDGTGFPPPEDTTEPPTAVPEPTATITATVVPPPPTAQTISVPPHQPLDPNNLPPTNHDLVYISAGTLWLWTHHNRQIVPLYSPEIDSERFPAGTFAEVALADFSADGNRAAVAVRYDLPPEEGAGGDGSGDSEAGAELEPGLTEFDILFVDVVSKEAWLLVNGIEDHINAVTISPDQTQIVFATVRENSASGQNGRLFRLETPSGRLSDAVQIAECESRCEQILWRQDSELFVFSNLNEILLANRDTTQANVILAPSDEFELIKPIAWSPNDRAILIEQSFLDQGEKGENFSNIFDIPTQQVIAIPRSNRLPRHELIAGWLSDSRYVLAESLAGFQEPHLQILRIDFDSGETILDEKMILPFDDSYAIRGFEQLSDGQFVFSVQHSTDLEGSGLYKLTSFSEQPTRAGGIPIGGGIENVSGIDWSAEGNSAIFNILQQTFISAADGNLYQFNLAISHPRWLPPSNAQR